ncbi:hypothetical protein Q5P01_003902 [Channa striata]|uniref:Uncharacterized protein n=1 Tax=Channa striata TaxID=64152 RepID=A0AA88NIG8_CHASR|nr:hypothetical protein Q5P01_003902 [Channa striata]
MQGVTDVLTCSDTEQMPELDYFALKCSERNDLIAEQHPAASPLEKRDVYSLLCSSVEGPFPQQITTQSIQSSGRNHRWGLGGNATTHISSDGLS